MDIGSWFQLYGPSIGQHYEATMNTLEHADTHPDATLAAARMLLSSLVVLRPTNQDGYQLVTEHSWPLYSARPPAS